MLIRCLLLSLTIEQGPRQSVPEEVGHVEWRRILLLRHEPVTQLLKLLPQFTSLQNCTLVGQIESDETRVVFDSVRTQMPCAIVVKSLTVEPP